jgi:protein SCO1/2
MTRALAQGLALMTLLVACRQPPAAEHAPRSVAPAATVRTEADATVPLEVPVSPPAPVTVTVTAEAGASPYDLTVPLTDDTGELRHLDVARGHVTLMALFYASCPGACPALINRLRAGLDGLAPAERQDVRVVLVTFDPQEDSVAALHGVRKRYTLDAQWHLLRPADDEAVRDVAAVLDIAYRRLPEGGFEHDSVVVVLDRAGRPVARVDSAALTKESLGAAVVAAGNH